MEANAVFAARKSGRVEKRFSSGGVVVVSRNVAIVGPMTWRQQARREPRLSAQQVFDYGFAICRVRERAANIALRE